MRCLGLAACWFRLLSAVLYSILKHKVGPLLSPRQALSQTCAECFDFVGRAQNFIDGHDTLSQASNFVPTRVQPVQNIKKNHYDDSFP